MQQGDAGGGSEHETPPARESDSRRAGTTAVIVAAIVVAGVIALVVLSRAGSSAVELQWEYATDSLDPVAEAAGDVTLVDDDAALVGLDAESGDELWRLDRSVRDVVVDGDRAYAACCNDDADTAPTRLLAIDTADGSVAWEIERSNADRDIPITFAPVTVDAGAVYIATNDDEVFAVDVAAGTELWSTKAAVFGSPTVHGSTLAVSGTGRAVAFDAASGSIIWTFETDPALELLGPVVLDDGFVFASLLDDTAAASDPPTRVVGVDARTGAQSWEYTSDASELTPPVAGDELVFVGVAESFGGDDQGVLAFDGESTEPVWRADEAGEVHTPVVGAGETTGGVYVGDSNGTDVFALDSATGDVRWTYSFDESGGASVAATDDLVWAAGTSAAVVGIEPSDGSVEASFDAPASVVSLTPDGDTLYLGTYGDGLVSLAAG